METTYTLDDLEIVTDAGATLPWREGYRYMMVHGGCRIRIKAPPEAPKPAPKKVAAKEASDAAL